MWPYLRPQWTNSCQIWCTRVFHHVLLKNAHKMLKSIHDGQRYSHTNSFIPTEISVYWPGSKFTLISMGLIRYSCGHISGHREPIHVKFDESLSSCSTEIWLWKCWNKKRRFDDVTLWHSILFDIVWRY